MRIWDIDPQALCRKHLLGEHRELHGLWSILVDGKKGYSQHPETLRWRGKLPALFARHERLVEEMRHRGYKHCSPLIAQPGSPVQDTLVTTVPDQIQRLRDKGCACRVEVL